MCLSLQPTLLQHGNWIYSPGGGKAESILYGRVPIHYSYPMISLAAVSQTDISIPLQPRNKDTSLLYKSESEINMPDQDQIDAFRGLLTGARRRERLGVPKVLAEVRLIN